MRGSKRTGVACRVVIFSLSPCDSGRVSTCSSELT